MFPRPARGSVPILTASVLATLACGGASAAASDVGVPAHARSLETAAFELFTALTRGEPKASESVLLHAHNLLGAARSFAHLTNDRGADRELLALSFTLLSKEAQLLEPLLPESARTRSWPGVAKAIADLRAALDELPPEGAAGSPPAETDP